jgi:high-affinity Fe2+/Pb2+ permease
MAIRAAVKRGGLAMASAYLMITAVKMEKFLRPVIEKDELGVESTNMVNSQHYVAQISIYPSEEERAANVSAAIFARWFLFEHVEGGDLVKEAYDELLAKGIDGWYITDMEMV